MAKTGARASAAHHSGWSGQVPLQSCKRNARFLAHATLDPHDSAPTPRGAASRTTRRSPPWRCPRHSGSGHTPRCNRNARLSTEQLRTVDSGSRVVLFTVHPPHILPSNDAARRVRSTALRSAPPCKRLRVEIGKIIQRGLAQRRQSLRERRDVVAVEVLLDIVLVRDGEVHVHARCRQHAAVEPVLPLWILLELPQIVWVRGQDLHACRSSRRQRTMRTAQHTAVKRSSRLQACRSQMPGSREWRAWSRAAPTRKLHWARTMLTRQPPSPYPAASRAREPGRGLDDGSARTKSRRWRAP